MRKLLGWAALAVAIAACNGSGGSGAGGGGSGGAGGAPSCGDTPTQCPMGQTCWFAESGQFECEPSGSGKEGEACAPTVGMPTCGDGLLCLKTNSGDGVCTKLCDAGTNPCGNLLCVLVEVQGGAQTHVCH